MASFVRSATDIAKSGNGAPGSRLYCQSLCAFVTGKKAEIKTFLLYQRFVAGLGNIYVDEALWKAKIHPARSLETLKPVEINSLHEAIVCVLKQGIENTGTSLGTARANYFSVSGRRGSNQSQINVFRRDGLPCPRRHTKIQKMMLAQRGTHFCPHCQLLQ